ncbi:MAG TPA: HAMP domain-containing sensor histidine kinase [Longimicrobiales bacterium]
MDRRPWPMVFAVLALIIFGSFLLYTERIMREVREEATLHSRMYAQVQQGLLSPEPGADLEALVALQRTLTELGVPVVVMNAEGEPSAWANLPFEAELASAADRERVRRFAGELDRQNAPIVEPEVGTIHFGAPPIVAWLRWVPVLQVCAALALMLVGLALVRSHTRAERERLWATTARDLAHQMGTPLSSLSGWVEVLGLPPEERRALASTDQIAREIARDVERLERVSRRFELIGQRPALERVNVEDVVRDLEVYLRPRLPRLGGGVALRMRVQRGLPPVRANRVLLVWALENLVKNSLDALAGRGGRIRVAAARVGARRVRFAVADNGPGVPASARERLFEPGFTTKVGGWGVGLALTRRIVEGLHGGRITHRPGRDGGSVFEIELPAAEVEERADAGAPSGSAPGDEGYSNS